VLDAGSRGPDAHGQGWPGAGIAGWLNRPDVALALVRVTLAYDPCDERARELAIRAHVARGDRASAIREYRDYAKALSDELGLTPSFALGSLIASHAKAV
jgi:DNA-binding SARP family transcriptional activator